MGLNFSLPSILGNELVGAQLAGDHRLLSGDAVRVINRFMAGFSSERASMAS